MKARFNKFLTLLAVLLLGVGSVWADPTYKSSFTDFTRVGETSEYYTMLTSSNYSGYISAGWMSYTGASTGSATLKINPATDEAISGSSATYGKVKNDGSRYMEFYVTGISSIKFYFANTGSSDRKIQYKLNAGEATDLVTVVQKTSNSGSISLSSSTNNTIRIFSPDNDVYACAIKVTVASTTTYTVTYKAGDGTGADVVDDEATVVADCPGTFSYTGYDFAGWKDALNNDVAVGATVSSDMTLTAQWAELFSVTYDAGEGSGTVPTEVDHIAGASFDLPGQGSMTHAIKAFAGWKDQDDNEFDAGDSYTMPAKDVTLTAQWVSAYTVTYNANGGTGDPIVRNNPATIEACSFTAPSGKAFAGWNTAIDGSGDPYAVGAAVSSTLVLYAQWKDVILLIKSGDVLNTEDFVVFTGTALDGTAYTVGSTNYTSNFKMGNTASAIAGQAWANKFLAYDVQSTSAEIKLYIYNKNSSSKNLLYQVIKEGDVGTLQTKSIASKGSGQVETISISTTKGARVVFGVSSTDVRFCQIEVMETGTILPKAMEVGYELAFPGRAATASNLGEIEGIEIKSYSEVKFASGISYLALRNIDGSTYVKFTTDEAVQLQVTTANANKFYVCEANIGDPDNDTQYGGSAGTHNANLKASTTYYVVPAAGSSGGEVQITKLAFATPPASYAVTYSAGLGSVKEGKSLPTQAATIAGAKFNLASAEDLEKSGYDFAGWLCSVDAVTYNEGDEYTMTAAATTFTAQWTEHAVSSNADLSDLTVNGVTVEGFDAATTVYNVELPMGTTVVPTVAGVKADANAKSVVVSELLALPGAVTVTVTAENDATKTYTINFSVATSKDIELVWDKGVVRCDATTPSAVVKSDDASVSAYINKITATAGGEGSSLNVGKNPGDMFTLSAKPGYAFKAMSFFGKIEDASCEYSLDGGAWQTLASTNTSGNACYADVFSAAEVHELRMKITGSNGFWIRNMQLTMIEACTPIVVAWDEEPVEFEVGKAGYAIAATANNSGTITYGSTDASIVAVDAGNGVLSVAALGSVSLSASTAEGDGTTFCANGGNPIVISKAVNTYYLVQFDPQNETAVIPAKYYDGDPAIALPSVSYSGHTFQGWFDAATGGNQITEAIIPAASRTIYAQWTADCAGPTITTQSASANYLTGRAAAALSCEATAGNGGALTYTWYSCDDDVRTNPVELAGAPTPSTAVAGTFYFFCAVTEEGCAVIANSDVATIVVTDKDPICLAWVNVTGQNAASLDPSKSIFEPEISASGIKNSSDFGGKTGWKFNSSPAALEIENAPFKAGDIVEVFVTTVSDDKMRVFKADEGIAANVVAEGAANMVQGANRVALTEDANNLYLLRKNDFGGWNPYVAYVAVYRACAPILNKITVAGVEGAPVGNVVTVEVPASTTQSQLEAITYDWVSNNDAWTAAHDPAVANAWEFGVENTVTFTDKDGDASVYTITVNKAAASANVELATLTVNGNAVAVVPGQAEYNYELPYGTSAAPTVAATAADANAEVGVITQAASATGSATFTVTAEDGTTTRDYTVNFSISKWAEVVIWDGSTMSAVATSPDATTGFAWAVTGFGSIDSYSTTYGEKSYSKYLPSGGTAPGRYVALNVPAGYVAKFYIVMASHSDGNERGMFIGSNLVKDPDATSVLELSNNDRDIAVAGMSEVAGAGTWYINPNASIDFQEIRAYLRPGYARTSMLGNGVLGTVCVDHNVAVEDIQGVSVYELMGREPEYGKLAFDEIVSGELEAGAPYVFLAHGDRMVLFYGNTKVDEPVDKHNGMYGTFTNQTLTELDDVYYFAQKALWGCSDLASLSVPANRAYVKLSEIDYLTPGSSPAPGRRRITLNVNGENAAQGFENIEAGDAPLKIMIDGTLYILRGEKVYNANGQLVK